MHLQKTLVVLKPDSIGRSIIWEIVTRFERAGLHIVWMKMVRPDKEFIHKHYEGIGKLGTRLGDDILNVTIEVMMKLPLIAFVIEGVEAVAFVRKMIGSTEPKSAAPGTIRGDYAHVSYWYADSVEDAGFFNIIHASATLEEANEEIAHWFTDKEIFDHLPVHCEFTR